MNLFSVHPSRLRIKVTHRHMRIGGAAGHLGLSGEPTRLLHQEPDTLGFQPPQHLQTVTVTFALAISYNTGISTGHKERQLQ
jgi:hypothetical protein